jgi:hypothetical protein
VAQGLSLEFKSHSTKKKKEINKERKKERKKEKSGKGKRKNSSGMLAR